jgi:hypothetical protein
LAVLCALACATGAAGRAAEREGSAIPTPYAHTVDIPPRRQWNGNSGYCGETSFISAGMYFGQYCSQFTARSMASPGVPQSNEESQLLLGVNEIAAAHRMRLEAVPFYERTQRTTGEYLAWVKSNVQRGHVVILGVYNNVRALDESPPGFQTYDHIVPVLGFGSQRPLERDVRRAYPTDVVTFSDNGLYGPVGDPPAFPFLFSYRLRQFPKTRRAANRRDGPVYALRRAPRNYAVAVTGIVDLDDTTVPVRLTSDLDGEPDIGDGSNVPPAPVPLALTARVTIPDQRVAYNLYRYDDFAAVPAAGFNAAAGRASAVWRIPAGSGPDLPHATAPTA